MNKWRALVQSGEVPIIPGVYDAFSAKMCERHGFKGVLLGGWDVGASIGVAEPLLSSTQMLAISWSIKSAVGIPIIIDGGTGFGEPMHVARFLSDCARMGIDGVFIEDQIFPKRAHYLNTYQEHTITTEEFVDKIRWARRGASDSVFLVARTDTFATESAEVAVDRANAALAAGADAVLAFPNNETQALDFPSKVDGPVVYNNLWGNRAGRPILTHSQAKASGYCMLWEGHPLLFAAYEGMAELLQGYAEFGACRLDEQEAIQTRKHIETVMDFAALWEIERATVEKSPPRQP